MEHRLPATALQKTFNLTFTKEICVLWPELD